jgi:uncharacterized membrane protein YheB (UPF0754 family)
MVAVIVGAVIGYVTNWLAIRMLFWPHEAKTFLGTKVPFTPGLFVRRRRDFSASIARVAEERFANADNLYAAVKEAEDKGLLQAFLDDMGPAFRLGYALYARKTKSFRGDCKRLADRVRDGHVLSETVRKNLDGMSSVEIEIMVMTVVKNELRAITWLGALVGAVLGAVQTLI